jgi:hypothetical protein
MGLFEQNDIVGDAVHLLEPYIGQGTQVDMEDAGTMALLVKTLCVNEPLEGCFCSTISNGSIDILMESMFNILMGMGKCNKSEPAILVKKSVQHQKLWFFFFTRHFQTFFSGQATTHTKMMSNGCGRNEKVTFLLLIVKRNCKFTVLD